MTSIVLFIGGLALLVAGAEALVRGAARLAAFLGIPPLFIGLTVVAFGTSAPEMAVSVQSGLSGQADIAIGNVVGSNTFNVLFILGVSSLITPLAVSQHLVRMDVPIMIGVSVLTLFLGLDGKISRLNGVVLSLGIVAYTLFILWEGRKKNIAVQNGCLKTNVKPMRKSKTEWMTDLGLISGGLVLLVLGSRWLVEGAVAIAQAVGLSELVIGLTIVAAGTSLPEAATSIFASVKGERDIAVGNVVGSNIFNLLAVLGVSGIFAPGGIPVSTDSLQFDIPVMVAAAIACLPIFFTQNMISRWEGLLFLGYYTAYLACLILEPLQKTSLPMSLMVIIAFVIPITGITVMTVILRTMRGKRKTPSGAAHR